MVYDQNFLERDGGAGVVTPSKPHPPTNNFCLHPPPVLRCFWKDPLMTLISPPPHFNHLSLLPPSPTNNFCLYSPPVLRCFWKDPLMTPIPHHPTSSIFHCYPPPHPPPLPPPPPKNFDHTHGTVEVFIISICNKLFYRKIDSKRVIGIIMF